jgi:hypothetical protein
MGGQKYGQSQYAGNLTLMDWYRTMAPTVNPTEIKNFTNRRGVAGIMSPDEFTVYFAGTGNVYVINYSIGLLDEALYPNLFRMIYESFTLNK